MTRIRTFVNVSEVACAAITYLKQNHCHLSKSCQRTKVGTERRSHWSVSAGSLGKACKFLYIVLQKMRTCVEKNSLALKSGKPKNYTSLDRKKEP